MNNKSLTAFVNESFAEDKTSAENIIKNIRKFISKILDIRKIDETNDYDNYFDDLLALCNSAIESIEYSVAGAVTESAEDKLNAKASDMLKHAEVILDAIKALAKSKVLSIEISDAKIDFDDIVELIDEFKVTLSTDKIENKADE